MVFDSSAQQPNLHSHDFGGHKIHFEPHFQNDVHHMAAMHPEERRDLFLMAKTRGAAHFESRPGVHMMLKHNHDGTYTLEHGHH